MEEPVTTVPRSIPRQPIIPVAGLTTQVAAVITRNHAGTTPRQRGIISQHRGITISRGFINRHHVTTSRRHEPITGLIRIAAGMAAITVVVGTVVTAVETTTIAAAMADATTVAEGATTAVAAITMAEASTVKHS